MHIYIYIYVYIDIYIYVYVYVMYIYRIYSKERLPLRTEIKWVLTRVNTVCYSREKQSTS